MNKSELEIIKRAIADVDRFEIERLDSLPTVTVSDEENFRGSVLAIPENVTPKSRISGKKLIIVLIAAAVLISSIITAYAFREPIKDFFIKKSNDESTTFSYESDNPIVVTEGIFMPSWLPEGYTKTTQNESVFKIQTAWVKDKDRIFLTQSSLSGDLTFDTEDSNYEEIIISNQKYHYISKNGVQSIIWMTEKYSFTLWCTNITKEDALKIATSLKVEKEFPKE